MTWVAGKLIPRHIAAIEERAAVAGGQPGMDALEGSKSRLIGVVTLRAVCAAHHGRDENSTDDRRRAGVVTVK